MLQLPAAFHPRREVHYVAVHGASQELDPLATPGHGPEHIKVNLAVSDAAVNCFKLYQGKRKRLYRIWHSSCSVLLNTFNKNTPMTHFYPVFNFLFLKFVLDQFFGICGIEKPRFIFFFYKNCICDNMCMRRCMTVDLISLVVIVIN